MQVPFILAEAAERRWEIVLVGVCRAGDLHQGKIWWVYHEGSGRFGLPIDVWRGLKERKTPLIKARIER